MTVRTHIVTGKRFFRRTQTQVLRRTSNLCCHRPQSFRQNDDDLAGLRNERTAQWGPARAPYIFVFCICVRARLSHAYRTTRECLQQCSRNPKPNCSGSRHQHVG